jgi:RNase adapter protein RapZ
MKRMVIITGLSGSGKTVALRALEDAGFYAIDNLPSGLIPELVKELDTTGERRVAVSIDVRSAGSIQELPEMLTQVRAAGQNLSVLFFDSSDDALVRRYAETRRPHPLASLDDTSFRLQEFIASERRLLEPIATIAERFDTSFITPHQLRAWIQRWLADESREPRVTFMSFGFKRGVPNDADFLFDVRSLPNPHYDPLLRPQSGLDKAVCEFLEAHASVAQTVSDINDFLRRQVPLFQADNRAVLTIAIGCTGGQHRSVYIAEQLALTWTLGRQPKGAWHRDITLWQPPKETKAPC